MNIVITGNCEKHDFVLTVALLLKSYKEESVYIITDYYQNYQYFNGEVSGIKVSSESPSYPVGNVIYDWHYGMPADTENAKVVFATNFEKRSIESIVELNKIITPDSLIVMETECSINLKYIEKIIAYPPDIFGYYDSPKRRIDWVFDGHVGLKRMDKDFEDAVGSFMTQVIGIPVKDIKKLWSYARNRG
jgi:hypothetical protein